MEEVVFEVVSGDTHNGGVMLRKIGWERGCDGGYVQWRK
jgi:hypothetical protein